MIESGPAPAPCVLKVGGQELRPGPGLEELTALVNGLRASGRPTVLVHGGGEEVTDRAEALGLQSTRQRGQRVTSLPMLEVVLEVLGGRINSRLVAALGRAGAPVAGVSGCSERMLLVTPAGTPPGSLGYVGEPRRVNPAPIRRCWADGVLPVVAPIGVDRSGQLYNVNADRAAAALAGALGAELWLVTDVPAVRDGAGAPVASLSPRSARALITSGAARDGMIPKLEAAATAVRSGSPRAWIGALADVGAAGPARGSGTWFLSDARAAPATPLLRLRVGEREG
jgi:acetylglutamate kinase